MSYPSLSVCVQTYLVIFYGRPKDSIILCVDLNCESVVLAPHVVESHIKHIFN